MPRIRTIKPEFTTDDKVMEVSVQARYLFILLWLWTDDMGRSQYSPRQLKALIFPGDEKITPQHVDNWMNELAQAGLIKFYQDGKQRLFWVPRFTRHQKIDRPSHSYLPPHPEDRKPDCRCITCKIEREEKNAPKHYKSRIHGEQNVPDYTRRVLDESTSKRRGLDVDSIWREGSREGGKEGIEPTPTPIETHESSVSTFGPQADTSAKDRRTQRAVIEEFARTLLAGLDLDNNDLCFKSLTKSIEVRARSLAVSAEESYRQIGVQAAELYSVSTYPENWPLWFEDMRYIYVPQGDARLSDRHIEARPTCGGDQCKNGWKVQKVNGHAVLERCRECEELWEDQGYSSE